MTSELEKEVENQIGEALVSAFCTALGSVHKGVAFACNSGVIFKKLADAADRDFLIKIRKIYKDDRINFAEPVDQGVYATDKTLQAKANQWGGTIWRDLRNAFWHPDPEFPLPSLIPDDHIFRGMGPVCTIRSITGRRNKYPGAPRLRAR